MRTVKISLVVVVLFMSCAVTSQTKNCSFVKVGKFELKSTSSGKTIIQRTENLQIETNDSLNVEAIYDVLWIDNCTYELKNRRFTRGKVTSTWDPEYKITVEIRSIIGNQVFIKTTSNYSEKVVERTLMKIE